MKRAIKPIIASIVTIVLFVSIAYLSKIFLIPKLPTIWQSNLLWLGGTAVATIMILAAFVQISGISVKDIFTGGERQKSHQSGQENIAGNIIINSGSQGIRNFRGDILQSSTKVVIEQANLVSSKGDSLPENVDKLMRDIQSALYGEGKQLPYVLTLSLDLCQQVSLASKYELWIRKELNGYENHEAFQKSFLNDQAFEEWMKGWANHRLVETYVKFGYRSTVNEQWRVDEWPFIPLFIGFPVAEIIRHLENNRNIPNQEFAISIKALGEGILDKLKSDVVEYFPQAGIAVPEDLSAFYKPADLEKLLNGIRNLVLSLLSEARSLQGE